MMRWAGPAVCFVVAAWIFGTLHAGDGAAWVLVGVDRWVGPSPDAQAALSWKILAACGVVWSVVVLRSGAKAQADAVGDD
jgi:membrane protease YdiL (CAAX protease family)